MGLSIAIIGDSNEMYLLATTDDNVARNQQGKHQGIASAVYKVKFDEQAPNGSPKSAVPSRY